MLTLMLCFSTDNNFVALTTILTFDTCVTEQCVNMSIIADSIDEPDVSFSYTITRVPGLDPRIILTPSAGKITILDDDGRAILLLIEV